MKLKEILSNLYDSSMYPFYERYLSNRKLNPKKILILGTIPRSGTHLIKFLFSNYILLLHKGMESEISSPSMMNKFFPNNYQYSYFNLKKRPFGKVFVDQIEKPTKHLSYLGLTDFTRSHAAFQRSYWRKSPVIHSYRNPLDYSVSLFHYMYKNRDSNLNRSISNPFELFLLQKEYYFKTYISYLEAEKSGSYNLIRFSYEELMKDTPLIFEKIIIWLGLEPNKSYILEACSRSSIRNVSKLESEQNKINPNASVQSGNFARHGGSGQWREYFSKTELLDVEKETNKYGLSLEDFNIDS